MNFATYEKEGHLAYAKLGAAIAEILRVVISSVSEIRVQQIQHRAKAPRSLRTKLEQRQILESESIESEIKDIAGCRVILYTNSDVKRLVSSNAIRDNFDVDWDRTKFHYPKDDAGVGEFFISYNYVLKLKEQRVSLPEYATFRDKWCEVQVQTTLDHAWSEMAHDTIYKPESSGFGTSVMKDVENRMAAIMQKYLLPAGFDFQKIADDVQRLRVGRDLYNRDALKVLVECQDNNERYDALDQFKEYVLPYYDNLGAIAPDVRACMVSLVKLARTTETTSTEHGIEGYTSEYVVELAFDVIDRLRFTHIGAIEATFEAICELFPDAQSQDERKRILESAEHLAKHSLAAWEQAGPSVQQILVKQINQLTPEKARPVREVLVETLGYVLEPEVSGTSSSYGSITIHQGSVRASEALKRIRGDAIAELEKLFESSRSDEERRAVVHALANATRLSHQGKITSDLLMLVLEDTLRIVQFYSSVANNQSFEFLQAIEHDLLWLYRHKHKLPPEFVENLKIAKMRDDLVSTILAFRDQINVDPTFVIYKTLVGFQSVLPPAWNGDAFDTKGEAEYRNKEIARLVGQITVQDAPEWFAIVRRCAQTKSDGGATFGKFLEQFGREKPEVLIKLLDDLDDDIAAFLAPILKGFEAGILDGEMRSYARRWTSDGQYLPGIAQYCIISSELDPKILEGCLPAAIHEKDSAAVLWSMEAAARRYSETPESLVETVLLPGIKYLAAEHNFLWVNAVGPFSENGSILRKLDESGAQEVLNGLVASPRIDYETEEILSILAEIWPLKVVDFFGERLMLSRSVAVDQYRAIPSGFHRLPKQFAPVAADVVNKIRGWFLDDDELFQYRGGAFLAHVFPEFGALEPPLLALVRAGNPRDIEFVLGVLRAYEGQPFLRSICKEVVTVLAEDDPLLSEIAVILDSTGVVTGQFGFVEVSQRRRTEMLSWLTDPQPRVQAFADRHIRSLDRRIAAEQRRSMESMQLRKRDYRESDPTVGNGPFE